MQELKASGAAGVCRSQRRRVEVAIETRDCLFDDPRSIAGEDPVVVDLRRTASALEADEGPRRNRAEDWTARRREGELRRNQAADWTTRLELAESRLEGSDLSVDEKHSEEEAPRQGRPLERKLTLEEAPDHDSEQVL